MPAKGSIGITATSDVRSSKWMWLRTRPDDYDFGGHRKKLQEHDGTAQDGERQDRENACDNVNDIELPNGLVKKAREEYMTHMKGQIFKVVKKKRRGRKTTAH
jgi:hypothetical protein